MKINRRQSRLRKDDADPLSVVVNLFDVAMVLAVVLMVSMVMNPNMQDFSSGEDFTIVKKKGDDMEMLRCEEQRITKYKMAQGATPDASSPQRKGKHLGAIYEAESDEMILVPSEQRIKTTNY